MQNYFFPNEWITIEAESMDEAIKILNSNNTQDVEIIEKSTKKKGV